MRILFTLSFCMSIWGALFVGRIMEWARYQRVMIKCAQSSSKVQNSEAELKAEIFNCVTSNYQFMRKAE